MTKLTGLVVSAELKERSFHGKSTQLTVELDDLEEMLEVSLGQRVEVVLIPEEEEGGCVTADHDVSQEGK